MNWYAYAGNNPVVWIDPYGLAPYNNWGDFQDWYGGGMGGASCWVDRNLLFGRTANWGDKQGLRDAGQASAWDVTWAQLQWGGLVAVEAYGAVRAVGSVGYHRLSPNILRQTGVSRRAAGRLHKSGKKILHVNLPGKRHVLIHRQNWHKPWKWFAKGK
jgi:hypothetical protein